MLAVLAARNPKPFHACTAALKGAVHPARPRREVQYVISELVHRLHHASDWLVSLCPGVLLGFGSRVCMPSKTASRQQFTLQRLADEVCLAAWLLSVARLALAPVHNPLCLGLAAGCHVVLLHRWRCRSAGSAACTPAGPKPYLNWASKLVGASLRTLWLALDLFVPPADCLEVPDDHAPLDA